MRHTNSRPAKPEQVGRCVPPAPSESATQAIWCGESTVRLCSPLPPPYLKQPIRSQVRFDWHTCSEVAPECSVNEDYAAANPDAGVFVVADGMGGRPSGDLASRIAACAFLKSVQEFTGRTRLRRSVLTQAVAIANAAVLACGRSKPNRKGMGSTLSAAVMSGWIGRVVHLGDSRIYLYQRGKIRQLTQDHTLVHELVRRKYVNGKDAHHHPLGHILLRTVGTQDEVVPDIHQFELQPGDGLILTTDEMARVLPHRELETIARRHWAGGARVVCEELLGGARQRQPQDDLTVMVTKTVGVKVEP